MSAVMVIVEPLESVRTSGDDKEAVPFTLPLIYMLTVSFCGKPVTTTTSLVSDSFHSGDADEMRGHNEPIRRKETRKSHIRIGLKSTSDSKCHI